VSDNRRSGAFEESGYELRCPVCEGLDYPGLTHNPDAPYCSENPAVSDNRRSSALRVVGPFIRIERRWWIRWRGVWHRMPL
jgi:hypothetical protein